MSSEDAKFAYVKLLKELDPSFHVKDIKFPKSINKSSASTTDKSTDSSPNIVTNIYDVIHPASEASSATNKVNEFWKFQPTLVEQAFDLAVKHAASPVCKNASNDQKAKLYGCFKQAHKVNMRM
jgi:hypothetical protein